MSNGQSNVWSNRRTTTKGSAVNKHCCQLVSVKIEHISCHRESEVLSENECERACVHTYMPQYVCPNRMDCIQKI